VRSARLSGLLKVLWGAAEDFEDDMKRTAKVYSFDVFDTCLVRTVARPADAFYLLAERILGVEEGGGCRFGREEVSELALARVAAERAAHRRRSGEEIALADIYAELPDFSAWGVSAAAMQQAEVALECELMRPVAAVRRRVRALREAGARVVFVSDMYLPKDAVRAMLVACGYEVPEDCLYVSSELGLTKRSGSLFKHVLAREGVSAPELLHCGDGVESDFWGARKAGVRAELFTGTKLNRFEKAMLRVPTDRPWVSSQIAGIARAVRLGADTPEGAADEARVSVEIAASVVAPLLTSFVLWTLEDARARALKRLYFVARDGQVLHKVARALRAGVAQRRPETAARYPEARYLYGSRQAWYLPSAFSLARDEVEFIVLTGQSSAPRHNLRRLNLTPEALEAPLRRHGFPPETWDTQLAGEAVERFWRFVEDPEVAPRILAEAERAREVALAYFEQEGLLADDRWALVDVGWTLRTQASLKKLLAAKGQSHLLGYYLGVSKTRFSALSYGQARAYLLEEVEDETLSEVRALFQNKGLIDQVFTMADHGSTRGYARTDGGKRVEPLLSPLPAHPKREAFLRTVQGVAEAFALELGRSAASFGESELRACARAVTGMLIARPTRQEARALAWAPISDDPNELRAAPLAKPLSARDLYGIVRDVMVRVQQARSGQTAAGSRTVPKLFYKDLSWGFSWLEGSVALSGPLAKVALLGFYTLQWASREKKTVASTPIAWWQRLRGGRRVWGRS
jgi:FMN phosphatase YigB (HAD superfamily)